MADLRDIKILEQRIFSPSNFNIFLLAMLLACIAQFERIGIEWFFEKSDCIKMYGVLCFSL